MMTAVKRIRPCAVVPSYNHWRDVEGVVRAIRDRGLPVFVVDDGSDEPAATMLARLHDPVQGIHVFRRLENGGKGAAVMTGLQLAAADGYTHVVQIDADGQHDPDGLDVLLPLMYRHPKALLLCQAQYDDSVPTGRKIGRWITHIWVVIETLSFQIPDTMCGFRIYPLASTLPLIEEEPLGHHMEFDVEIVVRLFWRGVQVGSVPMLVVYPPGNPSNFHMLRDNWRITKMHTRLFFTMLRRLPWVLVRRPAPLDLDTAGLGVAGPPAVMSGAGSAAMLTPISGAEMPGDAEVTSGEASGETLGPASGETSGPASGATSGTGGGRAFGATTPGRKSRSGKAKPSGSDHWASMDEVGTRWGIAFLAGILHLFGKRIVSWLLVPVVAFFYWRNKAQRDALQVYWAAIDTCRQTTDDTPPPEKSPAWRVFHHFLSFGTMGLNKFRAWMGHITLDDLILPSDGAMDRVFFSGPRGGLLMVSHLGNIEICRALSVQGHAAKITAFAYTAHALRFNEVLKRYNPNSTLDMVQVNDIGPHSILELKDRLDRGEWLAIAGDRTPIGESKARTLSLPFLGWEAAFPVGPLVLAHLLECPVYMMFAFREGDRFRVMIEEVADRVVLPRGSRDDAMRGYLQRYVQRLESLCLQYPDQWYNFFDFWRQPPPAAKKTGGR